MMPRRTAICRLLLAQLLLLALFLAACTAPVRSSPGAAPPPLPDSKPVSFAILEDYDKGDDLAAVARDFALMQELGIDTLRTSFGWDDYEPEPGVYDFGWLRRFVALAGFYGIQLRPYLAYTPEWAGDEAPNGDDGSAWNNPPRDLAAWGDFVFALAVSLRHAPNVLSYEIYNEENSDFWWDGNIEQYAAALHVASQAIRRADPGAEVLLGGLTYPDDEWLLALIENGSAADYDITPFHAYPETWNDASVERFLDTAYQDFFVAHNDDLGQGKPVWINEMGFATSPGRTEREQANWFARAASTFLADPQVEHLGFYEIRDLPRDSPALGDDANYYLGLIDAQGRKKLAFATVDLLTDLLDTGTLAVIDDEAQIDITSGAAGDLHHHLFLRPDGVQVLFVYDRSASLMLDVELQRGGRSATTYSLGGAATPVAGFDTGSLRNIQLTPGEVAIFSIAP